MYTELVGNFEASPKADLNAVNFNPSAVMRAQALGLMEAISAEQAADVYACSCCGSGCNCSPSGTWGCPSESMSALPSQERLFAAALAA